MRHALPSFGLGYGDKELFWITTTAAQESFDFEPHQAGSLGDCGPMIHYDPRGVINLQTYNFNCLLALLRWWCQEAQFALYSFNIMHEKFNSVSIF
jgi:hypothetical protein